MGDCEEQELRLLIETLKMDVINSSNTKDTAIVDEDDNGEVEAEAEADTEMASKRFKISEATPFNSTPSRRNVDSVISFPNNNLTNGIGDHDDESGAEDTKEANKSNEMVEVTPEVSSFFAGHFLANMMANGLNGNGVGVDQSDDEAASNGGTPAASRKRKASDVIENSNSMTDSPAARLLNGAAAAQEMAALLMSGVAAGGNVNDGRGRGGNHANHNVDKPYFCRLCGHSAANGASLFAHFLYPHYAHLWRTEIPHRANQYSCKQCPYTSTKRQHFVMHVARVHDDLRKKLIELGENVEVLDNLNPRNSVNGVSTERITSKIAKFKTVTDENDMSGNFGTGDNSNVNSPAAQLANAAAIAALTNMNKRRSLDLTNGKDLETNGGDASPNKNGPLEPNSFGLIPGRYPRGYKPFVKCRLCGKGWKGKDNFFTHLVSTHFKYLWAKEVPKQADMYRCHLPDCTYQSKYRYNFLFHLAGKHKQLKEKLAADNIPLDVLVPLETDEVDEEMLAGGSPTLLKNATQAVAMQKHLMANASTMAMAQFLAATKPPPTTASGGRTPSHGKYSAANSTVRLICRVCKKMSFNHTCHRQHVVGKHFQEFWSHHTPDGTGIFHCHHPNCTYKTPNRSVFVIHLAYVHSELKAKLIESGRDPNCMVPDVYGKRKYRRSQYDNTQHLVPGAEAAISRSMSTNSEEAAAAGGTPTAAHGINGTESPGLKFVCRLCKTEVGRKKAMVEHLALAHFNHVWDDARPDNSSFFVPPEGPYNCPHCPFTSTARQAFIIHFVSQHEALKTVMSFLYGDKTIEDLFTTAVGTGGINGSGSGSGSAGSGDDFEDGEAEADDADGDGEGEDDEEGVVEELEEEANEEEEEEMEDMDSEMDDGLEYAKMSQNNHAATAEASW